MTRILRFDSTRLIGVTNTNLFSILSWLSLSNMSEDNMPETVRVMSSMRSEKDSASL